MSAGCVPAAALVFMAGAFAAAPHAAGRCVLRAPSAVTEEVGELGRISCASAAPGSVRVLARHASRTIRLPVRRIGAKQIRITIGLPSPGRWTITARVGRQTLPRRVVVARQLPFIEAFRVVNAGDDLLVADEGAGRGRVVRVDPRTGERSIVVGSTTLGRVYDVEPAEDGLLVLTETRLVRLTSGKASAVADGLTGATDLVVDGATAYVADASADRVLRVDLGTGQVETLADGLSQPVALALAGDGRLYVADGHAGNDGRVRVLENGRLTPLIDGLILPVGLTLLGGGRLLVVDHVAHDANGSIYVYEGSRRVETLADRTIRAPTSAVLGSDGEVYVTSGAAPGLGRLDRATGRLRPVGAPK